MPSLPQPDNRVYFGKGGAGKTCLALHHAKGARRVIRIDPTGQEALAAGAVVCQTGRELLAAVKRKRFVVCWRGPMAANDRAAATVSFELANQAAWAAEDVLLVWDELDLFTEGQRLPGWAYKLVNMGRHRGCRVFATSRRPYRVPRDLTALATRMLVFRMQEARDLKFFADIDIGLAGLLPGLKPFHAVDWTEAGWKARKAPFS